MSAGDPLSDTLSTVGWGVTTGVLVAVNPRQPMCSLCPSLAEGLSGRIDGGGVAVVVGRGGASEHVVGKPPARQSLDWGCGKFRDQINYGGGENNEDIEMGREGEKRGESRVVQLLAGLLTLAQAYKPQAYHYEDR